MTARLAVGSSFRAAASVDGAAGVPSPVAGFDLRLRACLAAATRGAHAFRAIAIDGYDEVVRRRFRQHRGGVALGTEKIEVHRRAHGDGRVAHASGFPDVPTDQHQEGGVVIRIFFDEYFFHVYASPFVPAVRRIGKACPPKRLAKCCIRSCIRRQSRCDIVRGRRLRPSGAARQDVGSTSTRRTRSNGAAAWARPRRGDLRVAKKRNASARNRLGFEPDCRRRQAVTSADGHAV